MEKDKTDKRKKAVDVLSKIPPQNIDIEQTILGAIMIDPKQAKGVLDVCKADWFYSPENKIIYEAIHSLYEKNEPIDIFTVKNKLIDRQKLEDVGGAFYLTTLTGKVASSSHAMFHMRIIQQKYILREVIRLSEQVQQDCFTDDIDIDDVIHNHIDGISSLLAFTRSKEMVEMEKCIESAANEIEDNSNRESNIYATKQFPKFDNLFGLSKSSIFMLAADKESAKTAATIAIMYHVCENNKDIDVLWVSMEDPKEKIVRRMISMDTGYRDRKLLSKDNKLCVEEKQTIANSLIRLSKKGFNIKFVDVKITEKELKKFSRKVNEQAKANKKELIIVVDNIGLIGSTIRFKDQTEKDMYIMDVLVEIRTETNACIYALHHVTKEHGSKYNLKDGYRPRETTIKGSGTFVNYANSVALANLPSRYPDLMDVYKQRALGMPTEELKFTDQDFEKSFWKLNPNSDSFTTNFKNPIVNLKQATWDKVRDVIMGREHMADGTEATMNSLFIAYTAYYRLMQSINDSTEEDKYKRGIMAIYTWLHNGKYKEKKVRDKRDLYLFGDRDLTAKEQYELLKKMFIIEGVKIRDAGQGEDKVIRYVCDLDKNEFIEV